MNDETCGACRSLTMTANTVDLESGGRCMKASRDYDTFWHFDSPPVELDDTCDEFRAIKAKDD